VEQIDADLVGSVTDTNVKVGNFCLYKVSYYDLELSLLWTTWRDYVNDEPYQRGEETTILTFLGLSSSAQQPYVGPSPQQCSVLLSPIFVL